MTIEQDTTQTQAWTPDAQSIAYKTALEAALMIAALPAEHWMVLDGAYEDIR